MRPEDWDQKLQRSALLLSSTRIQVYLHLLLNLQEEKKKPKAEEQASQVVCEAMD